MWGRIYREESLNPSPCEEGFVGMDIATHLEVKTNFITHSPSGKDLQGRIAVHLRRRNRNSFPLYLSLFRGRKL